MSSFVAPMMAAASGGGYAVPPWKEDTTMRYATASVSIPGKTTSYILQVNGSGYFNSACILSSKQGILEIDGSSFIIDQRYDGYLEIVQLSDILGNIGQSSFVAGHFYNGSEVPITDDMKGFDKCSILNTNIPESMFFIDVDNIEKPVSNVRTSSSDNGAAYILDKPIRFENSIKLACKSTGTSSTTVRGRIWYYEDN